MTKSGLHAVALVPMTVITLVVVPGATRADESDEPLRWRDPAPMYTPEMLCAGECMLVTPPEIRQVQDEAQAITSFGNPRTRSKKHIPPLFDLIRDLFTKSREKP